MHAIAYFTVLASVIESISTFPFAPVNLYPANCTYNVNKTVLCCHSMKSVPLLPSNLNGLYLKENFIQFVTNESFINGYNLTEIDLSSNNIMDVSEDALCSVRKLEILRLDHNFLRTLPKDLFKRTIKLKKLYLHHNELETLPEHLFERLESLEKLVLRDNWKLKINPKRLPTKLQVLNLQSTDVEKHLAKYYLNSSDLVRLDLSQNSLKSVHAKAFYALENLEHLSLRCNHLETLHEKVFSKNKNLKHLDIRGNALTFLPSAIFDQNLKLEKLDLSGNVQLKFPSKFLPMTLINVNFSDTNIVLQTEVFNLLLEQNKVKYAGRLNSCEDLLFRKISRKQSENIVCPNGNVLEDEIRHLIDMFNDDEWFLYEICIIVLLFLILVFTYALINYIRN